jgi:hypothetical protein
VRVVSETLQLDAAGACLFSYLLKAEPDGYGDGLCRACAPHAFAHYITSRLRSRVPQSLWRSSATTGIGVITVTAVTTFGGGLGLWW